MLRRLSTCLSNEINLGGIRMRRSIIVSMAVVLYFWIGIFVSANQHFGRLAAEDGSSLDMVSMLQGLTVVLWPPFLLVDLVDVAEEWMEGNR